MIVTVPSTLLQWGRASMSAERVGPAIFELFAEGLSFPNGAAASMSRGKHFVPAAAASVLLRFTGAAASMSRGKGSEVAEGRA